MDKKTLIAHALTSEVMDENYRGTSRINKHGLSINKSQTIWNRLIKITKTIIKKYVTYSGTREAWGWGKSLDAPSL